MRRSMELLCVGPLVRAVSTTSIVIWAEFAQPCIVICRAIPLNVQTDEEVIKSGASTNVGGRYYIALQLDGLQPGNWYSYTLTTANNKTKHELLLTSNLRQCFRTLDEKQATTTADLRIAYGSCRKSNLPASDTLNALGPWLTRCFEQRESQWPHLLLLIGDQIYADQVPDEILIQSPQLAAGASTFDEFARLYTYAWTQNEGIRQALAVLPTYMIFDDHEITNNWNAEPDWRAKALQAGLEETLVDGQVAYWVYQGWGNVDQKYSVDTPLLTLMQEAAHSGEDVLEALRERIRADVYRKQPLRWHYEIPTHPPIFVANARTERTALFTEHSGGLYNPTRIISTEQTAEIQRWLETHKGTPAIFVSSVPVILPPVIGLAEYMMGKRLWQKSADPLQWLGQKLAAFQQKVATKMSFDHWPLYALSWDEMVTLFTTHQGDIIILSGDVHFSYSIEGKRAFSHLKKSHIYQFVSTPIQNMLDEASQHKIKQQARVSRASYGRLTTQMLPLQAVHPEAQIHDNILFQNTLAVVTIHPENAGTYTVQHKYLGIITDKLEIIGQTVLKQDLR